ncbi:MAG: hypothetical protein IJU87_08260 [Lachnospiraceae bacterium]|nr:hypothetical protein [Lachnospiraceae bacterium]
MAYKVSYKVVSEQGGQLKAVAKDMDNYVTEINGIVSKLGNDELLQSVRNDLNKFRQQLEEEKTVLNFAGQVIVDAMQSYTSVEKKSVAKVDKAKAHNRDFYKRPVSVPSAGTAATGAVAGAVGSGSSGSAVSPGVVTTNTTTIYNTEILGAAPAAAAVETAANGMGDVAITAAVGAVAAAAGAAAGVNLAEKKKDSVGAEAEA